MRIECRTQVELEVALKKCGAEISLKGSASFEIRATAQVTAYDSSQVRAYGSSQVMAYDSSQVTATKYVAVTIHGQANVTEGVKIRLPKLTTALQWCEFYGVSVTQGIALLYKAVRADFTSGYNGHVSYRPGTNPRAPDWDEGVAECGGGLHFSPTPVHALRFFRDAQRFVACPVHLTDMVIHPDEEFPEKVKARQVAAPVYEVDIHGTRVAGP